ncbi:21 kDa protein-like [Solanum dulcamara]|uniref:21 kDa protein-like n=1 Tax=Solanum dulcamara TaxID=45834 RepID=UPI002484FA63|nr:21 kDa protein-like [Solanum dulcamara]
MEKITLSLILFLFNISIFAFVGAVEGANTQPRANKFVESQCRRTRYPKLCTTSLSNYITTTSEPQELAHAALKVSLVKAIYTRAYVKNVCKQLEKTKAKDYQAVKDCLGQISDGVSLLFNSVEELHHLNLDKESEFVWHRSNVQTWLSTVLTDAFTCMDGMSNYKFGGYKVKATIKAKVLNVAQVTSNALALFNGYALRHKVSHH